MSCFNRSTPFENVSLIAHADWSINYKKRWVAVASRQNKHHWIIHRIIPARTPGRLLKDLQALSSQSGCILAGFDFPIGFPLNYAEKAGESDFLSILPRLGHQEWSQFYQPAESPSQITIHRPFYPQRPGQTKRFHLEQGLGLPFDQLYRLCEIAHNNRGAACPLFWTLGGQQVGKAALNGWKYLIYPALDDPHIDLSIWPFSGTLHSLCNPGRIVVVETYPAEFYTHLGLFPSSHRMSKRRSDHRKFYAEKLNTWSEVLNAELDSHLISAIKHGFGDTSVGEDQFDALVGLYGMINVIQGNHTTGEPVPDRISKIEGWIFGQAQPEKTD